MDRLESRAPPPAATSMEAIAYAWQEAVRRITYIPIPTHDLRARLEQLTAAVIDVLDSGEPLPAVAHRGQEIGRALIELNLVKPETIERTLAVLSDKLADSAAPERLGSLMAGIAGGFAAAAQASILSQQEEISMAATGALQRARDELAASRDSLAATNRALSAQIAERIRAEEAQRELAERLKYLHEIDLAILSAESLTAIVDISIDYIRNFISSSHSINILLIDAAKKQATVLRSSNLAYPAGRSDQITLTDQLNALQEGRVAYIEDLSRLQNASPGAQEAVSLGARSLLAVPLRRGEELMGALTIILDRVREFTVSEVAVVREIADSVAVAIQNRQLLEAEQAARERETTLREVSAGIAAGLELDALLADVLEQLHRVLPSASSSIILLEEGKPVTAAQRGVWNDPVQLERLLGQRPASIWTVLDTGQPFIVNDTYAWPHWIITPSREYIRAWLGVPLLVKGQCIGLLTIDRDEPASFTEQDAKLALAFGNQAAIAIHNAQLFRAVQGHAGELETHVRLRTRELEALYGITAMAVSTSDLDSLLQDTLLQAAAAFECPAGSIYLSDGAGGKYIETAPGDSPAAGFAPPLGSLAADRTLLEIPLRTGEPVVWAGGDLPAGRFGPAIQCMVAAPLRAGSRNLGVLSLLGADAARFDDRGLILLTAIADQIGAAMENIELRHKARQAAIVEERERLARDLHDSVTQAIYTVGLFAVAARDAAQAGDVEKAQRHALSIQRVSHQALGELRLLLFELRTEALAQKGLVNALQERLETVEHRAGIAATVQAPDVTDLPVAVEETFYRIALEALNNSLRHARASQVDIWLEVTDGELVMTVSDDGVGFNPPVAGSRGGMGLQSMQKRIGKLGGFLSLAPRPGGRGTLVMARAPLVQPGRGADFAD